MKHYLEIFFLGLKLSFIQMLAYRGNFIFFLAQNILNIGATLLSINFIFNNSSTIGGFNVNQTTILICTAMIVNAIYRGLILPNQCRFSSSILKGQLDFLLLKPVNKNFLFNFFYVDYSSLTAIFVPIIIIMIKADNTSFLKVLLYIVLILNGVVVISLLMLCLYSLSLIFVNVNRVDSIYFTIMDVAQKPSGIYKSFIKYLLFILIPVLPIANSGAMVLNNMINTNYILLSFISSFVLAVLYKIIIKIGISKYEAASS